MSGLLVLQMGVVSGARPHLSGGTIEDVDVIGDGVANITLRLNTDGTVDQLTDTGVTQLAASTDWLVPNSAAPGDWQVKATLSSGDTPTGTLGSFLALTTARSWTLTASGSGVSKSCSLLIEIADSAGNVVASGTYNLSAQVA